MDLYNKFIETTCILYTRVFQGGFFFLDLWSINHMWSGFVLYLIITAIHIKRPLLIILVCQFGYEIFEIGLTYLACNIFIPEIIKDQFTDIFIGFAGSCIGLLAVSNYDHLKNNYPQIIDIALVFFISMSFSFLWLVLSSNSVCSEGSYIAIRNLAIFFIWLAQFYNTISIFRKQGLFKSIKPWIIYISTFLFAVLLNFQLIILSDTAMILKWDIFFTWINSIRTKIILTPILPLILTSAHFTFVKLFSKSISSFTTDRLLFRNDFSAG